MVTLSYKELDVYDLLMKNKINGLLFNTFKNVLKKDR